MDQKPYININKQKTDGIAFCNRIDHYFITSLGIDTQYIRHSDNLKNISIYITLTLRFPGNLDINK